MTEETGTTSENSISVIEQSLMAFGAGMSLQARRDAEQSFRYASLRASKLYSAEGQAEQWFGKFLEAMVSCHWTIGKRSYEAEHTSSQSLTIEGVVFKVAKTAAQTLVGGEVGKMLGGLLEQAIGGLGKITEAQEIFKRNMKNKPSGTIGLGGCMETAEGEVFMVVSAHSANPSQNDLDTVVFDWKSCGDDQYSSSAYMVHDTDMYDLIRDQIKLKLKEHSEQDLKDHPI